MFDMLNFLNLVSVAGILRTGGSTWWEIVIHSAANLLPKLQPIIWDAGVKVRQEGLNSWCGTEVSSTGLIQIS